MSCARLRKVVQFVHACEPVWKRREFAKVNLRTQTLGTLDQQSNPLFVGVYKIIPRGRGVQANLGEEQLGQKSCQVKNFSFPCVHRPGSHIHKES